MQPGSDAQRSLIVRRLCDFHDRVTAAGFALAAILVGAIAAAFCYEVVARYFFSAPTAWTYDVGCYLLAAVIFLSIPEMTRRGAHIHVNLIFDYLPLKGVRFLRYLIGTLAVTACLAAAWITGSETWRQYSEGVWTLSALPIPKWWVSILIPYGMLSSALHFLRRLGRGPGGETLLVGGADP
jgi:TRAP-type C4-dicarboxylate transport system permease small subunit